MNEKDDVSSRSSENRGGYDVLEKGASNSNRRRSLQRERTVIDRDSNVNEIKTLGTTNGGDLEIKAACTESDRRGENLAMQLMKMQAEEMESLNKRNAALKIQLKRMSDVVNGNEFFTNKFSNYGLLARNIRKTLTMEVKERRKTIIKLKIKLTSLKPLNMAQKGNERL